MHKYLKRLNFLFVTKSAIELRINDTIVGNKTAKGCKLLFNIDAGIIIRMGMNK